MTQKKRRVQMQLPRLGDAARTLAYYVRMAHQKAGMPLVGECLNELMAAEQEFKKFDDAVVSWSTPPKRKRKAK